MVRLKQCSASKIVVGVLRRDGTLPLPRAVGVLTVVVDVDDTLHCVLLDRSTTLHIVSDRRSSDRWVKCNPRGVVLSSILAYWV